MELLGEERRRNFARVMKRPLLSIAFALALGAVFAWYAALPLGVFYVGSGLCALAIAGCAWKKRKLNWAAFLLLFFLGALITGNAKPQWDSSPGLLIGKHRIEGTVYSLKRGETGNSLLLESVCIDGKESDGNLSLYLAQANTPITIGDRIRFKGEISEFPGSAYPLGQDRRMQNMIRGIRFRSSLFSDTVIIIDHRELAFPQRAAQYVQEVIRAYFPKETAGIVSALLTGDRQELEPELYNAFTALGGSHIFAVSGMHVSILGGVFITLARRTGKYRVFLMISCATLLVFYALLTGAAASVMRAVAMWAVLILAGFAGREYDGLTSLAFAFIILLILKPLEIFSDSFLLSYSAAAAILTLYPLFSQNVASLPALLRPVMSIFVISLCVMVGTMPAVMHVVGAIVPLAPLYNLLLIPFATVNMIAGITVFSLSWLQPVAQALGNGFGYLNSFVLSFIRILAENANVWYCAGTGMGTVLLYMGILFSASPNIFHTEKRYKAVVLLTAGLTLAFLFSGFNSSLIYGENEAVVLDDRHAATVVYRDQRGVHVLTAPNNDEFCEYIFRAHGGRLDSLTLTGSRPPSAGALDEFKKLKIKVLYIPAEWNSSDFVFHARRRGYSVRDMSMNPSITVETVKNNKGGTVRYDILQRYSYYASVSKDTFALLKEDPGEIVVFNPYTSALEEYLHALGGRLIIARQKITQSQENYIRIGERGAVFFEER